MQVMFIAGILVAIAGVLFALQNDIPVTVTFFVWRFDGSLALVLLGALALGAAIAALIAVPAAVRARWTTARQRRQIGDLSEEIGRLEERLADESAAARSASAEPSLLKPPPASGDAREPEYLSLKDLAARARGDRKRT